jgi:hypothetical protein
VPLYVFGLVGFLFVLLIMLMVRKGYTETKDTGRERSVAQVEVALPRTLLNRTSLLLCLACGVAGLSLSGSASASRRSSVAFSRATWSARVVPRRAVRGLVLGHLGPALLRGIGG